MIQDTDIAVSGEPYIKKSKLLALVQEHLFEPLINLFSTRKKEDGGDIEKLETTKEPELDLEQSWEILQKAFDDGFITDEQFLKARESYYSAKADQAVETISKAFDNDLITEEQYLDAVEKAKTVYPIGTIKKFAGRDHIKTADGWKYHGKGTGEKAQAHAEGAKKLHQPTVQLHGSIELTHGYRVAKIMPHADTHEVWMHTEGGDPVKFPSIGHAIDYWHQQAKNNPLEIEEKPKKSGARLFVEEGVTPQKQGTKGMSKKDDNRKIVRHSDSEYHLHLNGKKAGHLNIEWDEDGKEATITDAKIDEEHRGKGHYKHLVYGMLHDNPGVKVHSVFRSDEADRAWTSFLKKLPKDIKHTSKHYKAEGTTDHMLTYTGEAK